MSHKLKIKVGPHEFDAEGTEESVTAQFNAFKELIQAVAAAPTVKQISPGGAADGGSGGAGGGNTPVDFSAVFAINQENKRLDLHLHIDDAHGKNQQAGDAISVILYGYKNIFQLDGIGSVEMVRVLKNAVGQNVRVDAVMPQLVSGGFLTKTGAGRATTYRITPKGVTRAEAAIKSAIAKTQA